MQATLLISTKKRKGVAKMKDNISKRNYKELSQLLEKCESDETNDLTVQEIYQRFLRDFPDVLNVDQVGQIIGASSKLTYKLLNSGVIKSLRVGRAFRIPKHFLLQYMNAIN